MRRLHPDLTILIPQSEDNDAEDFPKRQRIFGLLYQDIANNTKIALQRSRRFCSVTLFYGMFGNHQMFWVVHQQELKRSSTDDMHLVVICREDGVNPRQHSLQIE